MSLNYYFILLLWKSFPYALERLLFWYMFNWRLWGVMSVHCIHCVHCICTLDISFYIVVHSTYEGVFKHCTLMCTVHRCTRYMNVHCILYMSVFCKWLYTTMYIFVRSTLMYTVHGSTLYIDLHYTWMYTIYYSTWVQYTIANS